MSLPILYDATETNFTHLGLGVLSDAVSCMVTEERNGQYYLEMQYPTDEIMFGELKNDRLIKVQASNNQKNQRFKINRITKATKGLVTVYAEHASYLTQDLALEPEVNYVGNALNALNIWKDNIVDTHPFTVESDITTTSVGTWRINEVENARRALGGVRGSILDSYGGEYSFDNYHIKLQKSRGEDNGALIAYGKNLTDLEQDEEISNTYTSIYPFSMVRNEDGTETMITLPERFIDSNHVNNYARRKILVVDFTGDEITTVSALRTRAERYIIDNQVGVPKVNLKVKFIDLAKTLDYKDLKMIEEINLCDTVTVYFEKLDINRKAKVIKTVWNVLLDRYEEIEIGESRATLTRVINTEIKEQEVHTNIVLDGLRQQIISSYWNTDGYNYDLVAGNEFGLPGGYYSFDKPIDQNPTKAIYVGAGTLLIANSKNSNGTWNWRTMANGNGILADTIYAGLLSSANGQSYFDLNNNKIKTNNAEITGGYINIDTSSQDNSVVRTSHQEWVSELQPLQLNLRNLSTLNGLTLQAGGMFLRGNYNAPISGITAWMSKDGLYFRNGDTGNILTEISAGRINLNNYLSVGGASYSGYKFTVYDGNTYLNGNLEVTGTKNRIVETSNYGKVLLNAYETPKPTFADAGHGIIGEDGFCYIDIGLTFLETIDTTHDYRHFLTKYGKGDLWISGSHRDHFVVEGTPGLEFDWKIEATQKGYNIYNLEQFNEDIEELKVTDYSELSYEYLEEYEREILIA